MAQRTEPKDSLDDFPTPMWATRALMEKILNKESMINKVCLEPACGRGYMAEPLKEYFKNVIAQDIFPYGYGKCQDFLKAKNNKKYDWIITNPPFKLAEEFIHKSLGEAKEGLAIFIRTTFLESIGRYNNIFSINKPYIVAQFSERVPLIKGKVDKNASTATGYCWIIWNKKNVKSTRLEWVPPCRKELERLHDYELPILKGEKAKTSKLKQSQLELLE